MLMPTKIIQPVDSIFSISAYVLKILTIQKQTVDNLHIELNEVYYKKISLEKLILSLNFLYITDKVEVKDETVTIKI